MIYNILFEGAKVIISFEIHKYVLIFPIFTIKMTKISLLCFRFWKK